jgi:hypothetical protein
MAVMAPANSHHRYGNNSVARVSKNLIKMIYARLSIESVISTSGISRSAPASHARCRLHAMLGGPCKIHRAAGCTWVYLSNQSMTRLMRSTK